MDKLKNLLLEQETLMDKDEREKVEVLGNSIEECLKLASAHFHKPIYELEYEVLKRGKKSLFFSEPFHILVFFSDPDSSLSDLRELDEVLTGGTGRLLDKDLKNLVEPKDLDGYFRIKNYRHGVYLAVFPPVGSGKSVKFDDIIKKFNFRGIPVPPETKMREILLEATGEYERLGDSKLKQFSEATIKVEISQDHMKAFATFTPPKSGGRDLEVQDVVYELKRSDIAYGIKEDEIRKALDKEFYNEPVIVAYGDPAQKGADAKIIYHVRTEKKIRLKEDSFGRVDYKNLDLIENVVVNQLLAEKIPLEKGKHGRDLYNQLLEAKDGMDVLLQPGKGTILSEDGMKLSAEVNGQVIFLDGRVNVETVYRVNGDVNTKTGNITFLGSIVITGNIEDNFHVKASGNIEIFGTVQKAVVEADGDIVIRQGVTGREEARIITTNGNIIARFLQDVEVYTEKDVIVQEMILNSQVNAGGKVICEGKKAQILGGKIRAGSMVLAKNMGSKVNLLTEIIVGYSPKLLKQLEDYENKKKESQQKLDDLVKTFKTLVARKEADPASFTEEQETYKQKLDEGVKKLKRRIENFDKEIQTIQSYMDQTAQQGKVYIEKKMYSGVKITIKNSEPYSSKNEINSKIFYLENDKIRQKPYVHPDNEGLDPKKRRNITKKPSGQEEAEPKEEGSEE